MRYKELLTEQQLDELRMSPGSLRAFAGSSEAEGIRAGFEAELVFTGLGGEADYDEDPEPDYDADERANSIDDVINFFSNDEFGYATYGRDLDRLQDGLDEKYMEWHDDQMYSAFRDEAEDLVRQQWLEERPMTERVHDYLVEGMDMDDREADRIQAVGDAAPKFETSSEAAAYMKQNPDYARYVEAVEGAEEILEEDDEQSVKEQDGHYDQALDGFRDDFYVDDDSGFFGDVGLHEHIDLSGHILDEIDHHADPVALLDLEAALDDVGLGGGVLESVGDVGGHGVVEQHHVLRDQCNVGAQIGQPQIADVDSVELDHPFGERMKARNG
jgi:hypothetical protein